MAAKRKKVRTYTEKDTQLDSSLALIYRRGWFLHWCWRSDDALQAIHMLQELTTRLAHLVLLLLTIYLPLQNYTSSTTSPNLRLPHDTTE